MSTLRVVSLRSRSRGEYYDASVVVDDKYLMDEIDGIWENMLSQNLETIRENFGPFNILIKPRRKE